MPGVLHVFQALSVCAVIVQIGSLESVIFTSGTCREAVVTCAGSQNTAITQIPLRFQCWLRLCPVKLAMNTDKVRPRI